MRKHNMCRKRRYRDKREALDVARCAMRRTENTPAYLWAYPCARCRGWHLTSGERSWRKNMEVLIVGNEKCQVRHRVETGGVIRIELYVSGNVFLGGTLLSGETASDYAEFFRSHETSPRIRFDTPETYGPPLLSGARTAANA